MFNFVSDTSLTNGEPYVEPPRPKINWEDRGDKDGDSSSRVVMQVESSLVGRIIGMGLTAIQRNKYQF